MNAPYIHPRYLEAIYRAERVDVDRSIELATYELIGATLKRWSSIVCVGIAVFAVAYFGAQLLRGVL
jgi:hypothetical protein